MEFGNRQSLNKGRPHFRSDDKEAIGLAVIGGKLRQDFVVAYPGRGRQIRFASDLRPDVLGDTMPFKFSVTSR
jgi:hypothetical protein